MANILALEASTEQCSAALLADGTVSARYSSESQKHAQNLLPFSEALLSERSLALSDLDAIAFGKGPGSFTGIRIALSIAKGLAWANDLPMVGVSSLENLTRASQHNKIGTLSAVIACIDARMQEIYWSYTDLSLGQNTPVGDVRLTSPDILDAFIEGLDERSSLALLGSGARLVNAQTGIVDSSMQPTAELCVQIAAQKYLSGDYTQCHQAEADYVRNSVAWNKRKRIR